MKHYVILLFLCSCTLFSFAQKLQLEKASPFTAVKWEIDTPIVKFEGSWYRLEKLGEYDINEIIRFCKKNYGRKWQKRFSEDLVEVLKNMGTHPAVKVELLLSNTVGKAKFLGTYSFENRQKILQFNNSNNKSKEIKKITVSQAIEDIESFQKILDKYSSYIHLTDFEYSTAITTLKIKIRKSTRDIDTNFLTYELAKIMAEIGDRHSYVINEGFRIEDIPTYRLQLPFSITSLYGNVVALKSTEQIGFYEYLYAKYPYLKSINNVSISTIIDSLAYKSKKAPKEAKFSLGVSQIQQLGKLYFENNLTLPKQTKAVFTNGKKDTTVVVQLQDSDHRYYSKLEQNIRLEIKAIKKGDLKNISKLLQDDIGYIKIPQMFSLNQIEGLQQHIDSLFTSFEDTKALILDLRYNLGGTRDLIQLIGGYIVPKSVSPWVANVAYLRTDNNNSIYKSMTNRYLHTYKEFDQSDKKSIITFTKSFSLQKEFNLSKFSNSHYMILKSGDRHYSKPVYILVNEYSFSAASVFTSAFKGLPNVKIVGVTTDGSSGNSKKVYLKHSNITLKLSTMLSFQRNGKTLDTNGTKPDIEINRNDMQVLKGEDYQLNTLIDIINSKRQK